MNRGHPPDEVETRCGAIAPAVAGVVAAQAKPCLRFLCLAQVTNFPVLRRQLGRARADLIAGDLVERVARSIGPARVTPVDPRTVEIAFEGQRHDQIDPMVASLDAAFARPFVIDGAAHLLDVAIGGATGPLDTPELRLLEEAELSLGEARHDRRVQIRDATDDEGPLGRAALSRELPAAIAGDQLRLHYQPKIHLRRQEIDSVEALIRWEHPVHGMVQPGEFIALAEEMRVIDQMTLWTIRRVIDDQLVLRRRGYDPTIFINVSGQLLSDADFVAAASALVRDSHVKIGFEVTETSVIRDPESAIANLKTFADAGIVIAIDDYGAGLSSLAYLKQLPARELKIDKMFVTQLASSNRDPLIVRSTIDLAHALEMEVVAEGVETPAALALLTVMGCDMAQGFLISRPVALDALVLFLDQKRFRDLPTDDRFAIGRLAGNTRAAG